MQTDMDGVAMIAAERRRQVDAEGWTAEHDDQWRRGQLVEAAFCYAHHAVALSSPEGATVNTPWCWPWTANWWKPSDPVRQLVKAGALIAAEIDRLQRVVAGRAVAAGGGGTCAVAAAAPADGARG